MGSRKAQWCMMVFCTLVSLNPSQLRHQQRDKSTEDHHTPLSLSRTHPTTSMDLTPTFRKSEMLTSQQGLESISVLPELIAQNSRISSVQLLKSAGDLLMLWMKKWKLSVKLVWMPGEEMTSLFSNPRKSWKEK